jgi:hypothetical protein
MLTVPIRCAQSVRNRPPRGHSELHESRGVFKWYREGEVTPPRPEGRRILSSQVGSEPFGKFSTVLLFSTGYKSVDLIRSVWN